MKLFFQRLFIGIIVLATPLSSLCLEAQDLTGTYELSGVMEMAGGLWLKPKGEYLARFSIGAADWIEEGKWQVTQNGIKLSQPKFKFRNTKEINYFLPDGTTLSYQPGKLSTTISGTKIVFINPNKTPSRRKTTGDAGEGRMLVKGKVLQLDQKVMMVQMDDCKTFNVQLLTSDVLQAAKVGKNIDVEIPYSAIISSQSCPL